MQTIQIATPEELTFIGNKYPEIMVALRELYHDCNIYQRLDYLIELIDRCKNNTESDASLSELSNNAIKMLELICDTDDYEAAIARRKKYRSIDPQYIPNSCYSPYLNTAEKFSSRKEFLKSRVQEQLFAMLRKKYRFISKDSQEKDNKLGVARLDEKQREPLRILPAKGKFWQITQPNNSSARLTIQLFDTTNYVAHSKYRGRAIFVCSPQCEIFASSSEINKFHHSSILNAFPVFSAGTMEVRQGELTYIDDFSGHYRPTPLQVLHLLRIFKTKNLITDATEIQKKIPEGKSERSMIVSGAPLNTIGFLSHKLSSQHLSTPLIIKKQKEEIDFFENKNSTTQSPPSQISDTEISSTPKPNV